MEKTFQIKGMMCSHCEARVNKAVNALDGVTSCTASAASSNAAVAFDEGRVSEAEIVRAIEDTGYDVA